MYQPFVVNGVVIVNASRDETGHLPVDPTAYYGPAWLDAQVADPPVGACCAECNEVVAPDRLCVFVNDEILHSYCASSLVDTHLSLKDVVPQGAAAPPRTAAIHLAEQAVLTAALKWDRLLWEHELGRSPEPGPVRAAERALHLAVSCHQGLITWLPPHRYG